MDSDSVRGVGRRRLLGWGGLAAAVAPLVGARLGHATPAPADPGGSGHDRIPPDTRPGGAYDRYVAKLAAEDKFSGVVLLSHRGRTVLSRSYGMADRERGIRNHEGVAVNLGSAAKPFVPVAILQLAQRDKLRLSDPVGTYLKGFAAEIADKVSIHHLLLGTSGLVHPAHDLKRVFHSREEVHEYYERWTRKGTLAFTPGSDTDRTGGIFAIAAQIVEAVTGTTYWDYVHEHIFGRAGMTGSGFYTRPQWLTDEHIAHSYMLQADGSRVDAVRNLDKSWIAPYEPGKNPARNFIDHAADGGFATAPDLVRFAYALRDGTLLDRPFADLFTGAKMPHFTSKEGGPPPPGHGFSAYAMATRITNGQWVYGRGGGNPGSVVNWTSYPDSGWVGVVLSNYDNVQIQEILKQEQQAVLGRS